MHLIKLLKRKFILATIPPAFYFGCDIYCFNHQTFVQKKNIYYIYQVIRTAFSTFFLIFFLYFLWLCVYMCENWINEIWNVKSIMNWPTKFDLNPINSLSANAQKLFHQSEARKGWKISGAWTKERIGPPNFTSIWSMVCLQMRRNCLNNQRPGNSRKSVEQEQKLVWPGEAHNELVYQIWSQSDQQFVCKYKETVQQITGQEI